MDTQDNLRLNLSGPLRGAAWGSSGTAAVRGRVNAVDMIFIGASNELGEFESGVTAHWFGVVPAVILGGVGTLIVVTLWAWMFPELRQADRLVPALDDTAQLITDLE